MPSQREQPTYQELVAFVYRVGGECTDSVTRREALQLRARVNPGGLTETAKRTAFAAFAFKVGADPNWYNKTFQVASSTPMGGFVTAKFTVAGFKPGVHGDKHVIRVADGMGEIIWLSVDDVRKYMDESTDVSSRPEPRRGRRAIQL